MAQVTEERPSLHLTREYDAPPQRVWRAWTQPEALKSWFFSVSPEPHKGQAQIDLRVGGRFQMDFTGKDGEPMSVSGLYQEVDEPRRLSFTWAWKSTPERESLVIITLTPTASGTHIDFLHERFFDADARDRHLQGWTTMLGKLGDYLQAAG